MDKEIERELQAPTCVPNSERTSFSRNGIRCFTTVIAAVVSHSLQSPLVGLFVTGLLSCSPSSPRGGQDSVSAADSTAVQFVETFYRAYTPRGIASGLHAVDSLVREQPALFTPDLLAGLQRDAAARRAATGNIDGVSWDPFLGSQDPCDEYRVGTARRTGDRVLVNVHAVCRDQRVDGVVVTAELLWDGTAWMLADFIYPPPAGTLLTALRRDGVVPPPATPGADSGARTGSPK